MLVANKLTNERDFPSSYWKNNTKLKSECQENHPTTT